MPAEMSQPEGRLIPHPPGFTNMIKPYVSTPRLKLAIKVNSGGLGLGCPGVDVIFRFLHLTLARSTGRTGRRHFLQGCLYQATAHEGAMN